jgi:two-component system chemotaxis response regulator CheY
VSPEKEKTKYRVLIVDDSLIGRINLKGLLESNGHTVVGEAKDAAESIALHKETRPDLTTMDLNMPDRSGLEAIKSILEFSPSAAFIIISAVDQKLVRDQYSTMGNCEYVSKPIEWDKLNAAISRVMKKSSAKS